MLSLLDSSLHILNSSFKYELLTRNAKVFLVSIEKIDLDNIIGIKYMLQDHLDFFLGFLFGDKETMFSI